MNIYIKEKRNPLTKFINLIYIYLFEFFIDISPMIHKYTSHHLRLKNYEVVKKSHFCTDYMH